MYEACEICGMKKKCIQNCGLNPEGKRPFRKYRHKQENNVEIN
jgi:hypothetical protein